MKSLFKKIILFVFIFSINVNSYSQNIEELEKERKALIRSAGFEFAFGILSHTISLFALNQDMNDPNIQQPFVLYNSLGVMFDTLAIIKLIKARNLKKEIKNNGNEESKI